MAALIEAIDVKRKMVFEFENAPWYCMEAEVSSPTARGGQTLVRLKMRNLLTNAVFDRSFRAGEKFREPDLELVPATYLYSDNEGHHFLNQNSFETMTLAESQMAGALDFLTEGMALQVHLYNSNPIGLQMPLHVELHVTETQPGTKGDTSSGSATKVAKLETGLEVRVPLFVKEGDKVRVATETREFAGRA
ncbi:MAG TPA: elongation factor P [Acidobacteriaceae bacterium]|jgi:elongation factor P|nr:elongation factor P [Acidobacteriaceae bacterium]